MGQLRYWNEQGELVTTEEIWRGYHAMGLTAAQAAARFGRCEKSAYSAAHRYGFKWPEIIRQPPVAQRLTREKWLALHKRDLSCSEAAAEAGVSRSGAHRAAQRYGFEWRRVAPDYSTMDLSELSEKQQKAYYLARRKRFNIGEAYRIAKTEKEE